MGQRLSFLLWPFFWAFDIRSVNCRNTTIRLFFKTPGSCSLIFIKFISSSAGPNAAIWGPRHCLRDGWKSADQKKLRPPFQGGDKGTGCSGFFVKLEYCFFLKSQPLCGILGLGTKYRSEHLNFDTGCCFLIMKWFCIFIYLFIFPRCFFTYVFLYSMIFREKERERERFDLGFPPSTINHHIREL